MAYNSTHSGPEIDASVQMLSQIQEARDSTKEDLADVKTLAAQVDVNAAQVQVQAESVSTKSEQVAINALAVQQAHAEVVAASAAAEDSKDVAVAAAEHAAISQASASASEQAAGQSAVAAGISEQVSAESASLIATMTEQVQIDSASAREDAVSADASAKAAASLIEGHGNKRYATYAAMVADPQTRDGIIGVVDADATSSRNGWYSWNNTSKTWVYFADQPLMSAAYNSRIDGSEGIFSTIEEGLRNTRGTGLTRRYFRVTSTDEFYESRYRNNIGTALLVGRVLREPARLQNVVPNGSFGNSGAGNKYYGDSFPNSTRQSPIKSTTDATLAALGCFAGFDCPSTDAVNTGNFIEVDARAIGFDKTLQVIASVVVKSEDGVFDFGTGSDVGPAVYRITAAGLTIGAVMTEFTTITANVRVYSLFYRGVPPADGDPIVSYRVGFNVAYPRSSNLFVTGVWLSVVPSGHIASDVLTMKDTAWPAWGSIDKARMLDSEISLSARLGALEAPQPKGIKALATALRNPLHSVMTALVGDSIVAGSGSEYQGEGPGTIAKTNFTMKSFANLLRRNFGETYAEGEVVEDGAGGGYYEKVHMVDCLDGNQKFRWVWAASGRYVSMPAVVVSTSAIFGKYVDINRTVRPEFDLVGDNITFIHAQFTSTNPDAVKIEAWDVFTNTKLGAFTWVGSSVAFGKESTINFPFGRYRIQLRDASTGTEFRLRLEGLKVKQKVQVRNLGVSGSNSRAWLPGSANLGAIDIPDEFVLIQLGTNDRPDSQVPLNSSKTKANIKLIASYLISQGKQVVIMCASVALGDKEKPGNAIYRYAMNDVMRATREAAKELGVDYIDNYTPTRKAVIDGQTIFAPSDLLHPNNAGHFIIYTNIVNRITSAEA